MIGRKGALMYRNPLILRLTVRVVEVTDGDTVRVITRKNGTPFKVRLHGIDAPELDQPYGEEAKGALEKMVLGKVVYVDVLRVDRYGRQVGILHRKTQRNSFNKLMVELGFAYDWPKYGRVWGGHNAQARARAKRLNLWANFGGGVRPWSHRHGGTETPIEFTKRKIEEVEGEKAKRKIIEARVEAELAAGPGREQNFSQPNA